MNTTPSDPLLYPVRKAREALGDIGNSKFYQIVAAGQLKLVKIGSRSFVTPDELRRYVNSLSDTGKAA